MKNKLILIGVIALFAIIGLSITACGGNPGKSGDPDDEVDPEVTVTGIEITAEPDQLTYLHSAEALDLTGLEITAHYSDGTSEIVTDYTVSGFIPGQPGEQTITVSFGGKSATFTITVMHVNNDISYRFEGFHDEYVNLIRDHNNAIIKWDPESILRIYVTGSFDSYTWYLNGELQQYVYFDEFIVNGDDFYIVGQHTITVIVVKNEIPYSKSLTFMVVEQN